MRWLASQFELSRHGDAPNMRPMEGMRGFAVFLVFLVHYATLASPWTAASATLSAFADQLHTIGNAGVDLFFVLSGYLIYGSIISRAQPFLPFIRRRIARIYPAFCVVFAMYLALSLAFPKDSKIPAGALAAWLYVAQNFLLLPGLFPIEPMITVAWSLSYEMFYYLAIPLLAGLFGLRQRSSRWRTGFFVLLGTGFALYCLFYGGPARLLMFIAGILLHEALRKGAWKAPRSGYVLGLLAASLLATTITIPGTYLLRLMLLFAAFFLLCYACFSDPSAWLARAFCWTPLRWLGNMSYSYYLLHGVGLKIGFTLLASRMPTTTEHECVFFFGMLPLMFVISLLPAAGLFVLVERPFSLAQARPRAGSPFLRHTLKA